MTMQRALLSATVLSGLALVPLAANAKEAWLAAVRTCVQPSGLSFGVCPVGGGPLTTDPVPVWSFVSITKAEFDAYTPASGPAAFASFATAAVPGPLMTADSADGAGLKIHLLNTLPMPVSLVVPGLPGALTPVWVNPLDMNGPATGTGKRPDGDVTSRVRSLNAEAAPNGGQAHYAWPTLSPGSYLYQSGTHQAVQVQMGLHGPLVVASGTTVAGQVAGTAYPNVTYAQQVGTYLTEIDSAMHRTIDASPTHDATPDGGPKASPLEYWPNIFLSSQFVLSADQTLVPPVNGRSQIAVNQPTLMRFFNGTLRSHVQVVQNQSLAVVAEDGLPYPYRKNQYSVLLDAGKTKDAVMLPPRIERIAVYDRMLNTGNAGNMQQGLLAGLDINAASMPTAYNDKYSGAYGVPLTVTNALGVLANDVSHDNNQALLRAALVTNATYGSVTLNANGGFTYTPTVGSNKLTDSFSYKATETVGGTTYSSQQATVNLTFTATAPVAGADTYYVAKGGTLAPAAPGVLTNDTPAGNGAVLQTAPGHAKANGFTLAPNGSFSYAPVAAYTGVDTFTYGATNPAGTASGTVTINVLPSPVAANDGTAAARIVVPLGTPLDIKVLANDTGAAGATNITFTQPPGATGTVSLNNGAQGLSLLFTPKKAGNDSFTYTFTSALAAPSGSATVFVKVQ